MNIVTVIFLNLFYVNLKKKKKNITEKYRSTRNKYILNSFVRL